MNLLLSLPPKDQFFQTLWYLINTYSSFFIRGILITLLLSIVGTLGGFLLSLVLTMLRTQTIDYKRDSRIKRWMIKIGHIFADSYITVFRGTPMIVQAMIFYYGISPLRLFWWTPLVAGLFVVTLNTTAYIAEVIRSGINGIDKGQMEAARSLGFSRGRSLVLIIYPQAIKNSLPAIGNEFIVNLKDTAVLSVIGVFDLFRATQSATSSNFRVVEGFFIAAIIYLIMTYFTSMLVKKLEQKMDQSKELSHA
ncbi:MAG: amino acid ABC transporter permease [Acholeplasmataceae bacterium]|jgi:putative lysine transport system permease protein|nr:amino acid ABC transporter permease [Acholeplasmataceae bacterium]